jgi:hypothetical protein
LEKEEEETVLRGIRSCGIDANGGDLLLESGFWLDHAEKESYSPEEMDGIDYTNSKDPLIGESEVGIH